MGCLPSVQSRLTAQLAALKQCALNDRIRYCSLAEPKAEFLNGIVRLNDLKRTHSNWTSIVFFLEIELREVIVEQKTWPHILY